MRQLTVGDITHPIAIYMVLGSDHFTPATGVSVSVRRGKNAGALASGAGAVNESGFGWYAWTPAAGDVDTGGSLLITASATGCDDYVTEIQLVSVNLFDGAGFGLSRVDATISGVPDALLKRDWTSVTGEASRSVLNALRMLRNRLVRPTTSGTVTVYKEDDTTPAWTATLVTDASTESAKELDPT